MVIQKALTRMISYFWVLHFDNRGEVFYKQYWPLYGNIWSSLFTITLGLVNSYYYFIVTIGMKTTILWIMCFMTDVKNVCFPMLCLLTASAYVYGGVAKCTLLSVTFDLSLVSQFVEILWVICSTMCFEQTIKMMVDLGYSIVLDDQHIYLTLVPTID